MRNGESENKASPAPARRFLFGPAVFHELSLELVVSGHGVELERKPLEVLRHLLLHSGEVVTKDELAEACWPGRILSDSVLSKALGKLREALNDESQALIKTVHGYGYRLIAPVKVEAAVAAPPPKFDFKPGDTPPLRPLWKLEQRLGAGGHGEVWLARHEKTRETRVFKFALDGAVLSSLKREITIYRLLNDTLGEREDFVRILDWNLTESPYFVEADYVRDGNLQSWAEARGGLSAVPLETRLDLMAQMADALAAAHSVGVLHKDLKPANVLIAAAAGAAAPGIKLCDFGSGGVLDPQRLERLGITRLGFTKAIADTDTSGTLQYIAPEVMAGQPATVQADIYALGVILYQLVMGDLRKPLASGWEQDISDELLREDIADATNGNPARRIGDAGALARRLRNLVPRRQQRVAEQQAAAAAERSRRDLERSLLRRVWMGISSAALAAGLTISLALYFRAEQARGDAEAARKQAEESALTAKAVSDFMTQDLLQGVNLSIGASKDVTVKEVLERAAATADERFKDRPAVAAQVHASVAQSFAQMGLMAQAHAQAAVAVAQLERVYGRADEQTTAAIELLSSVAYELGRTEEALQLMRDLVARTTERAGRNDWKAVQFRSDIAWILSGMGLHDQAVAELNTALTDAAGAAQPNEGLLTETRFRLAYVMINQGAFAKAERILHELMEPTERMGGAYGIAKTRLKLGHALLGLGRLAEAEPLLVQAVADMEALVGKDHIFMGGPRALLGELRLEQGRLDEAEQLIGGARAQYLKAHGPADRSSLGFTWGLAETYQRQNRVPAALKVLRESLAPGEGPDAADITYSVRARTKIAELLLLQGDAPQARRVLEAISSAALGAVSERHPSIAHLRRVQGLLWLEQNEIGKAREALAEALAIYGLRNGPDHWRTKRAREELAKIY